MDIELFSVIYRPSLGGAPIALLCQAVDIDGEKFLWIDGINSEDPVLVSISAVRDVKWAGSFKEFIAARPDIAQLVIAESDGSHSPTALARAMLYMSRDTKLTVQEAMETVEEQAMDILEADDASAESLGVAMREFSLAPA